MRRPRVSGEVSFFLHTCKKNETSVYPPVLTAFGQPRHNVTSHGKTFLDIPQGVPGVEPVTDSLDV